MRSFSAAMSQLFSGVHTKPDRKSNVLEHLKEIEKDRRPIYTGNWFTAISFKRSLSVLAFSVFG